MKTPVLRIRGTWNRSFHKASAPSKTTSMHRVRPRVVEGNRRPSSPGHHLPDGIVRRIPQSSSLSLSFLFVLVWIDLQEPNVAFEPSQEYLPRSRESPKGESPGCSQESLSFSARSQGTLAAWFSGVTSHCRTRLLGRLAILCH